MVVFVIFVFCRGDHIAGQGRLAVGATQGIEFEQTLLGAGTPSEVEVGGQHLSGQFGVNGAVDRRRVECRGVAYDTTFRVAGLGEEGEERVGFEGSGASLVGLCRGRLGFGALLVVRERFERSGGISFCRSGFLLLGAVHLGAVGLCILLPVVGLCQTGVEGSERTLDFIQGISFPEFEVGATLEELAHTFRFLDAGHFDHDLAHLSATFEDLDVGLRHTEAVDTLAHHLIGVVDGGLDFFLQDGFHLRIGAVGRHAFALEFEGEESAELVFTHFLLVETNEDIEEVLRRVFGFRAGFGHDLFHLCVVGVAAGQVFHDIGNRHLENDVHAAFQVEAQTDLHGFALLVVVAEPNCFVALAQRVEIGLTCLFAHGFCLLLVVTGHKGETQIEEANQGQADRNELDKSFVLH